MCIPFSTWLVIILVHTGAIWDLSPFRLALYGLYLWKLGLQWTQKLVMCPARPFMGLDHFDPYWYPENIIRPYEGLLRLALQLLFCEGFFIKFSSLEQPLLELAPSPNSFRSSFCSPTVFPFYHSMLTYSISLLSSHCFPNMIPTKPYKTRHHGWYWGFLEWGTPKSSMVFYLLFHFKPSILGYPHDFGNLHIRRVPSGKRLHSYWKWPQSK